MAIRLLFCVSTLISAHAQAAQVRNDRLSVTTLADGAVTISQAGAGQVAISSFQFPWQVAVIERSECTNPTWGTGEALRFVHTNGWLSKIAVYEKLPFAIVTTRVVNDGGEDFQTHTVPYAKWQVDCGAPTEQLRVVGTGGLTSVGEAEGSYTFHVIADPGTRQGVVAGWLTHERGIGVFFPGVAAGRPTVGSQIDVGSYRVPSGNSRPTELLLIGCFDDVRLGLEAYADAIADHYRIRLHAKPCVYCTWYHAGASNERDLKANVQFASKHLQPFGLSVIQIDDKWQRLLPKGYAPGNERQSIETTGPIKVFTDGNSNFPSGMAHMADAITSHGMVAGLWFMPFAGNFRHPYFDPAIFAKTSEGEPFHDDLWSGTCIDLSSPQGRPFVRTTVRRIYDWGYRYCKIDGMHTGLATRNIYVNKGYREQEFDAARLHDPDVTPAEAYRNGLAIVREEAPDAYVLGCNVSQNMYSMGPSFGMIDAMRIGPDNNNGARGVWRHVTLGAWHGSNLYFLNNRVWHNDPDPVYVRPSNPLHKARWMCSWMAVAGALHTSSEQYDQLPPDRLDLLKRCLPSHELPARPVDYLEQDQPRIWLVSNDRTHVVGLFNWNEDDSQEIRYDLDRLGLPAFEYIGYEYWSDRFLKPFSGELRQSLAPASCQVLTLRPAVNHPQLVSTSRHITQGLMDVEQEDWDATSRTLRGRSKVVSGDLYQMRIVTPTEKRWKIASAAAGTNRIEVVENEKDSDSCLRLQFTPGETGVLNWELNFDNE